MVSSSRVSGASEGTPSSRPTEPGLTAVAGIGPKVAERLAERGVSTLAQLAHTTVDELAVILKGLAGGFTANRIAEGRWREQAAELASAGERRSPPPPAESARPIAPALGLARHNFTVEAALDVATGSIIAAQIDHVQSGDQKAWQQWDRGGVLAFIEERMGVSTAPAATHPAVAGAVAPAVPSAEPAGRTHERVGGTLHSYALVPRPGLRCERSGALRARISFDRDMLGLAPSASANVRVNVFVRRRPDVKAELVGSHDAPITARSRIDLVVPCRIPADGEDKVLFAVVEVHTPSVTSKTPGALPGAALVLLDDLG